MGMFRKKSVALEARQYPRNGLEAEQVAKWCSGTQDDDGLVVETPDGELRVYYGDWIIKNSKGEFCPCDRAIFEADYEEVQG